MDPLIKLLIDNNPHLAELYSSYNQTLEQLNQFQTNTEAEIVEEAEIEDDEVRLKEQNEILKQNLSKLKKRLKMEIAKRQRLIIALGGCRYCSGEDVSCPHCHGNGRIGYYEMDEGLVKLILQRAGITNGSKTRIY